MFCYNCGCHLSEHDFCTSCGADVSLYKKIMCMSNRFYNDGLEKAGVRDLTGAINSLRQSLKFNKNNIEARNLLGLVYYERGETSVQGIFSAWCILRPERSLRPSANGSSAKICVPRKTLRTTTSICYSPMPPVWMPLTRRSRNTIRHWSTAIRTARIWPLSS